MDIKELGNKLSMYENIDILLKETNEEWTATGSFEIDIPSDVIDSICTMGSNDAAVEEACAGVLRPQLDKMSDEYINDAFNFIGFDMTDEERAEKTRQEKEHYLVWDAAWSAFEDDERQIDESVEDDVKDHKNLAPEVDADKLKKEIENKKK